MKIRSLLGLLLAFSATTPAQAAVVLETVLVTPAQQTNPLMVRNTWVSGKTNKAGDTRVFTLNKNGVINVTDTVANTTTVFNDLRSQVVNQVEQGLVGMTFDPDYASNGRYYVLMHTRPTVGGPVFGQVMRFTDPAIAIEASQSIFRYDTMGTTFHQGGWLDFAPDNTLMLSVGDGSHFSGPDLRNTGQDPGDVFGSILRIDPFNDDFAGDPFQNYAIPLGNLSEMLPGAAPEVFAYGVRNPFRNSIAPDGNLLIADVGQSTQEEITILPFDSDDRNLGWSLREGDEQTPGPRGGPPPLDYVPPVYTYDHFTNSAITGGYVYRGTDVSEFYGRYIFGDLTGDIWSIQYTGTDLLDGSLTWIGNIPALVSFGETNDGELLATQYLTGGGTQIFRFTSTRAPVPEPATWAMMIAGFAFIAMALRRGDARPVRLSLT